MNKTRFWPRVVAAFASGTIAFAGAAGCSMCCGPYDYHYPTFGGRVQRADPEYGRVGSIFSDPYTAGTGLDADSNVKKLDPPKSNNREDNTEPAINRETSPLPRPQAMSAIQRIQIRKRARQAIAKQKTNGKVAKKTNLAVNGDRVERQGLGLTPVTEMMVHSQSTTCAATTA